jgi:pimeloyl-ACP methyl ester carboxylesterase
MPIALLDQTTFARRKIEARLANGQRLAYADLGPAGAPALVLIHGLSDNARSWSLMAPHLMDRFRLILPDLRGHGGSEAPECCYGRGALAWDVKLLLDHLGLGAVALAGHSLGSMVAFTLAARWPASVSRLVLESCSAGPGARDDWLWRNVHALVDPIDPDSDFMRGWYGNPGPVPPDFLARLRRESAAIPARVWRAVLRERLGNDGRPELADVGAPTLILHGERDAFMTAADQADLRAGIPHARFRSFPALGHNPHWEEPEAVAAAIAAFVVA